MNFKNQCLALAATLAVSQGAMAACTDVSRSAFETAIKTAAEVTTTGGYSLPMWVTLVDETGKICHVASSKSDNLAIDWNVATPKTGALAGNTQWLGSRVISAQKAFTANAFSLDGYAISTANLYASVTPGGSLYGLQHSNPVDATLAYKGSPSAFGTDKDPLKNKTIGGVNVFGGGLALYSGGKKIGAIGVSGDTSCRDHAFAWHVRGALSMHASLGITNFNMDASGAGQTPLAEGLKGDELIINASGSTSYWDTWSQPACPNSLPAATLANGIILN